MQIRSDHCYWLSEFIVAISQWLFLFWKDLRFCFQRNEAVFKMFSVIFFYVHRPVAVYINIYWESKTASPKYCHFCMLSWCDFLIINSETRKWSPYFVSCKSTFTWFFTIWVLGLIFAFNVEILMWKHSQNGAQDKILRHFNRWFFSEFLIEFSSSSSPSVATTDDCQQGAIERLLFPHPEKCIWECVKGKTLRWAGILTQILTWCSSWWGRKGRKRICIIRLSTPGKSLGAFQSCRRL